MKPWWADGVWEFIENKLGINDIVFEWGSGNSTKCLSNLCKVISIENDIEWYRKLKNEISQSVDLHFIPDGGDTLNSPNDVYGYSSNSFLFNHKDFSKYVMSIDKYDHDFSLIVIDGRSRTSCLAYAIPKVKKGGMLLLDDSWRDHYQPGILLIPDDWSRFDFKSVEHTTSVWVQPK